MRFDLIDSVKIWVIVFVSFTPKQQKKTTVEYFYSVTLTSKYNSQVHWR